MPLRPPRIALFLAALALAAAPAMASSEGNVDAAAKLTPYFSLETLTVSIVRGGRVRGLLSVQVELEVNDTGQRVKVRRSKPRLRDAYLRSLVRYSTDRLDDRKPLDIQVIKHVLQRVTDQVLEPGSAEVFIGMAMIRRTGKKRR